MNPDPQVSSRNETAQAAVCCAPGCDDVLPRRATGRPARYCSAACRTRAHRQQHARPGAAVTVEVDMGSASSRGRRPESAWLVRLRRDQRTVIVTIGLSRPAADHLAEQISDLLSQSP